jgi:hypothetical protein
MDHPNMPPKTVALFAVVCLTTGWVLASVLSPPVAKSQALPDRRSSQQSATSDAIVSGFSEHLKLRLQAAPEPPTPRRNPFRFGTRERAPEPASSGSRASSPAAFELPRDAAPVAVGPVYTLAGMAVTGTAEGTVRTAVLADGRAVHLVKIGDAVGGYTVAEMTDTSVTLVDLAGTRYVLTLPSS